MPKNKHENITGRVFNILATADTDAIRHEDFEGEDHLVVPIVALIEGVIQGANASTPELALAEVFGLFPLSWNGRPVTLDHPEVRGMKVSASQTPDVHERETLGFLFNTELDGKKLKTEAWINLSKVEEAGEDVVEQIARFESGEVVEVSTGLFALVQQANGTFEGENYQGIWTQVVPDHLAILPEGTIGACSVEDGCGGPRLNNAHCECASCQLKENEMPKDVKDQDKHDPEEDARKKKEEEDEKDNSGHQKKKKKKKMNSQSSIETDEEKQNSMVLFLTGLRDKFSGVFKLKTHKELSDIDTRRALTAGLVAEDEHAFFEIVAVFENSFVYAKGFDGTLLSRGFSIADEGEITLNSEVTEVRPVTEFVPVNLTEEKTMTTNKEVVDGLIANEATQFTEDDREWLESQDETRLNSLSPVANSEDTDKSEAKQVENKQEDSEDNASENAKVTANSQTAEEFIESAPAEMQEVLSDGLRMQREVKDKLVKELVANERCGFSNEELKEMKTEQLRKLSKLGNIPSYEGQAGSSDITTNKDDNEAIPDAPIAFKRKTAANE